MEVIGNALELRAFDRMEEDIRLIGYFKNEDSECECTAVCVNVKTLMCFLSVFSDGFWCYSLLKQECI